MPRCDVCFHNCNLSEGQTGLCMARRCQNDRIVCDNYGQITGFALDPIEKKPLYLFYPGSRILSVGSYGCNLRCPFCQNYTISYDDGLTAAKGKATYISPEQLASLAMSYVPEGNIGVAFTYNEPLVGYEYVRDAARLVKQEGLHTVLVTNGSANLSVLQELLPVIDAMNVDLKGFSDRFYSSFVGGDRQMVMDFIAHAAGNCHLEVTTLVIPKENDDPEEINSLAKFLSDLGAAHDVDIPLHLTRYFPRYHLTDRDATDVDNLFALADIARKHLKYVFVGNV